MKKISAVFLFLSQIVFANYSLEPIVNFRDTFYSCEKNSEELTELYHKNLVAINKIDDYLEKKFLSANLNFYMGRHYQILHSEDDVIAFYKKLFSNDFNQIKDFYLDYNKSNYYLKKAESDLKSIYVYKKNDSQYLFFLGNVLKTRGLVESLNFLISNNIKANKFFDKGLKSNPDDIKALITLASSKTFTPSGLGGNPKLSLKEFLYILNLPNQNKDTEDFYRIYIGLGFSYFLLKDFEKAKEYIDYAKTLFPNNVFLRGYAKMIDQKMEF